MRIFVERDYDAVSDRGFALFMGFLPEMKVLGLATGNTPLGLYTRIRKAFDEGIVSLKGVRTFNLDEYFGIPAEHPLSYRTFMNKNLFDAVDIAPENIHFPESMGDPRLIVKRYDSEIDNAGHPDVQILGIGQNAHIAFNEPRSPKLSRTRIVMLSPNTVKVNNPPSKFAVTMGLRDILASRRIIMLASGKEKADAVANMVDGQMSYLSPASYLQEHPETYVIVDEAAASKLDIDYIKERNRGFQEISGGIGTFDL